MAGSLNKATLIGRLGSDVEIKTMQSGERLANLSLATSEMWKDRDGQKQERTTWHRVVIFNEHLVKVAENYLKKGSLIYVEGAIQNRSYEDRDGVKKYVTEIVLQKYRGELTMLDGKSEGQGEQTIAYMKTLPDDATPEQVGREFAELRTSNGSNAAMSGGADDVDMSDIPF